MKREVDKKFFFDIRPGGRRKKEILPRVPERIAPTSCLDGLSLPRPPMQEARAKFPGRKSVSRAKELKSVYEVLSQKRSKAISFEEADEETKHQKKSPRFKRISYFALVKNSFYLLAYSAIFCFIIFSGLSLLLSKNILGSDAEMHILSSEEHFQKAQEALSKDKELGVSSSELKLARSELKSAETVLIDKGIYCFVCDKAPLMHSEIISGQRALRLGLNLADVTGNLLESLQAMTAGGSGSFFGKARAAEKETALSKKKIKMIRADLAYLKNDNALLSEEQLNLMENRVDQLSAVVETAGSIFSLVPSVLGKAGSSKYLLLFQNNREIRPGGGFLGTYATFEFNDGIPATPKVGNTHALNLLFKDKIDKAKDNWDDFIKNYPEGLAYTQVLEMNDKKFGGDFRESNLAEANWSFDFSKNAQRATYLYEDLFEGGVGSVDGVVAINPKVVEDLLKFTGEIDLPDYGVKINSANFRDVIEYKVEVDNPYREGDFNYNPKQILADFAPKLLDAFSKLDKNKKIQFMSLLLDDAKAKEIMIFSKDQKIEDLVKKANFDGTFAETGGDDFAGVYFGNISASKTSLLTEKDFKLKSVISESGEVSHSLNILATNHGDGSSLRGVNKDFVEVVVPEGSSLSKLIIDGMEKTKEAKTFAEDGKAVLGFVYSVDPGKTANLVLDWQSSIPFNFSKKNYSFDFIKQSGIGDVSLSLDLALASEQEISEYSEGLEFRGDGHLIYQGDLSLDRHFSVNFK